MKHPMAVQECWATECAYLVEGIDYCYIEHPFLYNYLDWTLRDLKGKRKEQNAYNVIECFFVHVQG